ncbi:hypothetical protein [uncultured Reyranella sp.]|uniref:hypothetical protein n=1 Tax=uncultured Reyranella sp. TaxID=735512 RepID=UPI0025DD570D|nr:hypothetical protein [uncultured Reyranella sp.]
MKIHLEPLVSCALAVLLLIPASAHAQPSNEQLAARCAQLGALYDRYNTRRGEGSGGPDMTRLGAGIDCQKGRYEQGIKALEELLQRSRIPYPPAG